MGTNYTFCNCKNTEAETEGNFKENLALSHNTNGNYSHTSRHDAPFSVKASRPPIDLNKVKQKAAVNKIIKAYRAFKIKNRLLNANNNSKNTNTNNNNAYDSSTENSSKLKQIRASSMNNISISYIGDKVNGQKEGFGIQTWNGGAKYIGTYKGNKAEGYGKFIASNDRYEGEFLFDGACGFGLYHHSNGALYEGEWRDDAQENIGIETWKDGSLYKGEYSHGKKNGIGQYQWPDGSRYEGEWVDNTLQGYGIYYFTNNRIYLGEWKCNMKEGFGEFIWSDKKYIGYYVNDKKEGFGIYYWQHINKAYMGFWKEGKQNGFGKYMTNSKIKYGIWSDDGKIKWINEEEAMRQIEDLSMTRYKEIFAFTLDDICNYFTNNDVYNSIQSK